MVLNAYLQMYIAQVLPLRIERNRELPRAEQTKFPAVLCPDLLFQDLFTRGTDGTIGTEDKYGWLRIWHRLQGKGIDLFKVFVELCFPISIGTDAIGERTELPTRINPPGIGLSRNS